MDSTADKHNPFVLRAIILLLALSLLVVLVNVHSALFYNPRFRVFSDWQSGALVALLAAIIFALIYFSRARGSALSGRTFATISMGCILVFGAILRTYQLDQLPLGLFSDEALFGYEAYSIATTGRDHWGESFPAFFKAFGSYSNGLYYYCATPIMWLFGPSILAVRLTSVILGLAAIVLTYLLAKHYFSEKVGLVAALLLAISTWHIQYSRIAMDPIAFAPFFLLGFYLLTIGIEGKSRYLLLSAIPLGLSLYSYAVARFVVPVLLLFFLVTRFRQVLDKKYIVACWIIILALFCQPMLALHRQGKLQQRFEHFSIASNQGLNRDATNELRHFGFPTYAENKVTRVSYIFLKRYFRHLSPEFMLRTGDGNYRHHIGGRGQILWFSAILAVVGALSILLSGNTRHWFFLFWALLFPIPAALTWEGIPHAGRAIAGLPVIQIIASVGLCHIITIASRLLEKRSVMRSATTAMVSLLLAATVFKGAIDFAYYLGRYYGDYRVLSGTRHDYKLLAIHRASKKLKNYDAFLLTIDFPVLTFAFLERTDPRQWHRYRRTIDFVPFESADTRLSYLPGERFAVFARPGTYTHLPKVSEVRHEVTGQLMFEVREIDKRT